MPLGQVFYCLLTILISSQVIQLSVQAELHEPESQTMGDPNDTDATVAPTMSAMEMEVRKAYETCWIDVLSFPYPSDGRLYCNATFDNWGCWNYTLSGTRAFIKCPVLDYPSFPVFDVNLKAFKDCNQDGTWWRHPETNKSWSNYTTCIDLENLNENRVNVQLYIAGYSCSLAAISIALFIFFYFRQLQCTRITIHKNLFASFILTNTAWIVWYTEVNTVISVLTTNPVWCQVLHVVNQYFMSCNYLWMFCEGMYLHTMIVFAFVTEKHIMKLLALVGWGFPALLAIVYGAVRGTMPDGDLENCWIKESRYMWIITAPLCLSIVANLFFLCNIMRVLITKLRAVNTAESHQTWKAVRAVLILIPLLGVYYIIMWVPPGEGSNAQVVYQKLLAIFSSFQGFFVALIFCFLNGEVLGLIKKKWYNYQEVHGRGRRFSTYNTTMTENPCQQTKLMKGCKLSSNRGGNSANHVNRASTQRRTCL